MKDIKLYDNERLDYINEDLSLIQRCGGLTFGTDAYLLSAFAGKSDGIAVDLGSGTGVAALLCAARCRFPKIFAAEVQPEYYDLIRRNVVLNELDERVIPLLCDIRQLTVTDIGGRHASVVISNPPYMKAAEGFNCASGEKNIARRELNGGISDFAACAARLLKHGGYFYSVYRPDRLADLIFALKENSLEPKKLLTVYPDSDSAPCLVLIEAKKGASSSLSVAPPLFIYNNARVKDKVYTPQFAEIYENCSMKHIFPKGR